MTANFSEEPGALNVHAGIRGGEASDGRSTRQIRTPGSDRGAGRRLPVPTGPTALHLAPLAESTDKN